MNNNGKLLEIVLYPSDVLTKVSAPVTVSIPNDESLQELLIDMAFTMQHYMAAGLAAIQVGVPLSVIVVQDQNLQPVKMINPKILNVDGSVYENEGCLSVPYLFFRVKRPEAVTVHYFDENGVSQTNQFHGLLARAVAHEIDHTNGVMHFDKLSSIEKAEKVRKFKHLKRKIKRT